MKNNYRYNQNENLESCRFAIYLYLHFMNIDTCVCKNKKIKNKIKLCRCLLGSKWAYMCSLCVCDENDKEPCMACFMSSCSKVNIFPLGNNEEVSFSSIRCFSNWRYR